MIYQNVFKCKQACRKLYDYLSKNHKFYVSTFQNVLKHSKDFLIKLLIKFHSWSRIKSFYNLVLNILYWGEKVPMNHMAIKTPNPLYINTTKIIHIMQNIEMLSRSIWFLLRVTAEYLSSLEMYFTTGTYLSSLRLKTICWLGFAIGKEQTKKWI